jgi:RNA polymerase sigma-70 factor, ECF subfamily
MAGAVELEERIRGLFVAGDLAAAATMAIESYGPEVLGWLVVTTNDVAVAEDAFAAASEDLWRGLATFRWECSVRTWMYTLTKRALVRHRKRAAERPHRRDELGSYDAVERARSRTAPWLRTEVKDAFARLRAALAEDERELLILRVDRQMSWEEIALIVDEPGDPKQVSARVRKRFQSIKDKLRDLAQAEGLVGDGDGS